MFLKIPLNPKIHELFDDGCQSKYGSRIHEGVESVISFIQLSAQFCNSKGEGCNMLQKPFEIVYFET